MKHFSLSVIGASHVLSKTPMQDWSESDTIEDKACFAVISDGHGASKHFRSDIGSKVACEVTLDLLKKFYTRYPDYKSFGSKKLDEEIHHLKLSILSGWQHKIEEYTKENPFSEAEMKNESNSLKTRKSYDVSIAYGATLLASFIAKDYYLLFMIGDGAILELLPNGESKMIEFEGKKVFDDEPHSATDSLCNTNAYYNMHVIVNTYEGHKTVSMCSDGLSEAFHSNQVLGKKLFNYTNFWAEEGYLQTKEAVHEQLEEISRISPMKDDISLTIITNDLNAFISKEEEIKSIDVL